MSLLPFNVSRDPLGYPPYGGAPPVGFSGVATNPNMPAVGIGSIPGGTDFASNQYSRWQEQGRITVNNTLHVSLYPDQKAREELERNCLLFTNQHHLSQHYRVTHQYRARCLSAMNLWLGKVHNGKTPYEHDVTPTRLLKNWSLYGIQQTDVTDEAYSYRQGAAITVHVRYRALMPDLWLSTGQTARQGDTLWLLVVKVTASMPEPISMAWVEF